MLLTAIELQILQHMSNYAQFYQLCPSVLQKPLN